MRIYFQLLSESFRFAKDSLVANKLRTLLSLLGVTIGIFAIIVVLAMVDSIKKNLNDSVKSLGEQVVYIQKWPWVFQSDFPWWKYLNRPVPTLDDYKDLATRLNYAAHIAFQTSAFTTIKYGNRSVESANVLAVTEDYDKIKNFDIALGRYLTDIEFRSGRPAIVLGAELAVGLFDGEYPIGKTVLLRGRKLEVIGVLKREGQNLIDFGLDNASIVPLNLARSIVDIRSERLNPFISVKAKEGVSNAMLMDEIVGAMRAVRRLSPQQDENFSVNEPKLLSNAFDQLIGIVNLAGLMIGAFSILVGGFGIANIMFVSVAERTNIIGIQKALGAKNEFILSQFLFESIVLCLLGGAIGLLFVQLLVLGVSAVFDMEIFLSVQNIIIGIGLSTFIGLVSGIAPALSASKLDPVEAMRAK